MSLMSLGMVLMSLGVGLEQELGDEFDECLASVRGTARERALSEWGGESGLVARGCARTGACSATECAAHGPCAAHSAACGRGETRRGRSRRAVDSSKIW